jgi:hypothetical protein
LRESQLGVNQMRNINKAFLDQQISMGKAFVFTGNTASATAGYFAKLEFLFG